mmetsp:Transcript_33538/g.94358  ORF Transcript_33538/g.94358 Transcript_33538/m.94358 type:complete len:393 (-) Transcript_33538:217-1395(-)|eukprot:CAMPEP_0119130838 /NCGR_PEP_ID=MMETSP1310-20130426/8951_1 /TAXON_ID=464262 /ORGANISM="Genus nov. species nov., Strain RCC2339" /LENGTH=392 /DNA_ID=CAMNT_0007121377 /DNA_START=69 /DNA_END=1247 /DNA_ORIENTATION=+
MKVLVALVLALALAAQAEIYFEENFDRDTFLDKWVLSTHKGDEAGPFALSAGDFFGDAEKDVGLKTMEDARFYQISAQFPEFSNRDKTLVIQYSVKHEQNIDCGGAYVKLLPAGLDQTDFNGDSEYNVMFGPDVCGSSNKKIHAILNYDNENHLIEPRIFPKVDELSHVYTFILNPDQTYEVLIDNKQEKSGDIHDWAILADRKIPDPEDVKPSEWVDEPMMDDPEDIKPEGYDDIPEMIADPEAEQPEDWDEDLDGVWEAPMVNNPDYLGPWSPRKVENPDYKGPWIQKEIDNPEYKYIDDVYAYNSHAFLGIEIWQVKAGTIFDNFLVTDDVDVARERADAALERFAVEKEKFDEHQEAERLARQAEMEAMEDDVEDDDDDDDDEAYDEL